MNLAMRRRDDSSDASDVRGEERGCYFRSAIHRRRFRGGTVCATDASRSSDGMMW